MDNLDKKAYFNEYGYVVIPNLIDQNKIDNLLGKYKKFKKNNCFFYSQSHHNWNRTKECLDKYGNLTFSIENFTDLLYSFGFSKAGREILQSDEILYWLKVLGNYDNFNMHGNMFFDRSTATADHLDTWYIDTNPRGSLIAIWIALEEIDGKGGAFVVYPRTHLKENSSEWLHLNHEEYLFWAKKLAETKQKKELFIKKGDAVFWHPSLLHGSTDFVSPKKTRKSITAHYFPNNYLRSDGRDSQKNRNLISYINDVKEQNLMSRSFGYSIKAQKRRREIIVKNFIGILNKIRSKYNEPKMLMDRKFLNKTNYE